MAAHAHTPTASGTASPRRTSLRAEGGTATNVSQAGVAGPGTSSGGGRASKRALRDYYGIQAAAATGSSGDAVGDTSHGSLGSASDHGEGGQSKDPHDPDSSAFNVAASYEALVSSLGLAELLRKSAELVSEIRELDGEKQSLVYNHHHELVAASETIRKMKARADGLDPSLDSLQASFSTMSQLSETLALPADLIAPILEQHRGGRNASRTESS